MSAASPRGLSRATQGVQQVDNYAKCVDRRAMPSILSDPLASTVIVVDASGGATLTDIALVSEKPISTVQRAVDALELDGILRREAPRGALVFRPDAPRQALCELAGWCLGPVRTRRLAVAAAKLATKRPSVPRTIKNPSIRDVWPRAIESIVRTYHPAQVILFGSQARGDATPDSDVDLLIVFDRLDDRRERRVELRRLLRDMPFAKDVLVATPEEVAHPAVGTAIAEAAHDGLVVYER